MKPLIAVSIVAALCLAGLTGIVGYMLGQGDPVVAVVEVERLPKDTAEALAEAAHAVAACVEATGLNSRFDRPNGYGWNQRTLPDARLKPSGGQGGGRKGTRADVPARLLARDSR